MNAMSPGAAVVTISVLRQPVGPGAEQKWNATYLGEPLVSRVRVPSFDSCRALLAKGITGRVDFIYGGSDTVAFCMDIEKGAELTIQENDEGIRVVKYRQFPRAVLSPDRIPALDGTIPHQEDERASYARFAMADMKKARQGLQCLRDTCQSISCTSVRAPRKASDTF